MTIRETLQEMLIELRAIRAALEDSQDEAVTVTSLERAMSEAASATDLVRMGVLRRRGH